MTSCNGCTVANALTPGALCVPCVEASAREAISVRLAEQAITIFNLKEELRAIAPPTAATCGTNPLFPAERMGCGRPIATCAEVYRCVDCATPFHVSCIKAHFASELTGVGSCSEADRLRLDLRAAEAALMNVIPVLECAMDLMEREQDRGSCFLCDTKLAACKCSDMYAFRKAVWPHHPFRPSEDGSRCTFVKPEGDAYCDSPKEWHPGFSTLSVSEEGTKR